MFTVGEFSRLAQVSTRLLRYYDEIGLLKPLQTDRFTNYRYYSAEQLPQLNRILALKELGLSLEQIQRLLRDQVSTDELQGMLMLKKAEIEQQLQTELQRIRNIEARLRYLRHTEAEQPLDVVIKQVPAQPVLSMRMTIESFAAGVGLFFEQVVPALPAKGPYGLFFAIWHSGGPYESSSDIEIGRMISAESHEPVVVTDAVQLQFRHLPAVSTMATFVVQGSTADMHIGYSAIGQWAEVNGYRFAGPPRELFLRLPQAADMSDAITEIQYPVAPAHAPNAPPALPPATGHLS
jgi:DNA-binding transcriptional MerR regulator/effector-binding domain-containing protein